MANTVQDNNRVAWGYVTADATPITYCVSAKAVYVTGADAAKFGGAAAPASSEGLPKGFRMRAVKCVCAASNKKRWVPVYTVTGTLWTTPGTSVTMNENGVDAAYVAQADRRQERKARIGTRDSA